MSTSISRRTGDWLAAVTNLVYPRLCLNCRSPLHGRPYPHLCLPCSSRLVYADLHELPANSMTDRLRGRLPVSAALALLHYTPVARELIHNLKYERRPAIGRQLGEQLGELVAHHPTLSDLDGIVPVPLHPRRRHERGYNQAEEIAAGVAVTSGLPVFPRALKRTVFLGSQTRLSQAERVENTRRSFATGSPDLNGRHLLLVDDVFTTGATVDFCGNTLLTAYPDARIAVATLAVV